MATTFSTVADQVSNTFHYAHLTGEACHPVLRTSLYHVLLDVIRRDDGDGFPVYYNAVIYVFATDRRNPDKRIATGVSVYRRDYGEEQRAEVTTEVTEFINEIDFV